jgi:hypothetical protein
MKGTMILAMFALAVITLVATTGVATADPIGQPGGHPNLSMKPGRMPALNNVVSMDAQGVRQAICPCGQRFTVGPQPQSIAQSGTVLYLCSDGCARDLAARPAESLLTWNRALSASRLNTNVRMKQGLETATCPCGNSHVLVGHRRAVVDNGLIVFFCNEECRARFAAMPADERMAAELRMLYPGRAAQPVVELTYCLLPTEENPSQGCATVTYRLVSDATVISAEPPNMR